MACPSKRGAAGGALSTVDLDRGAAPTVQGRSPNTPGGGDARPVAHRRIQWCKRSVERTAIAADEGDVVSALGVFFDYIPAEKRLDYRLNRE